MFDLGLHAVFTFNATVFAAAVIWYCANRSFPNRPSDQQKFVLISVAVVAIRTAYVVIFVQLFPDRILSSDGVRYLFEIRQIAEAPWEWNPITGTGPYYQATPKMGMSYLYGLILFVHQIDSLYAVLVLNILVGLVACIVVFLLTSQLTTSTTPAFVAMLLMAAYPETLFWTARVTRENVVLLLLPSLVYVSIRLYETYRPRFLVYAITLLGSLLLVRAQLVLFALLIAAYFGLQSLSLRNRARALAVTALAAVLLYTGFSAFEAQIRRAAGAEALRLISLDHSFWVSQWVVFLENIGAVLSPVARGTYGSFGLLMIPFALGLSALLLLTLLRFRRIFAVNVTAAGLLLFLSVAFVCALAFESRVNIRFRATVAPFVLSLVSVTAHYVWNTLRLPRLRP